MTHRNQEEPCGYPLPKGDREERLAIWESDNREVGDCQRLLSVYCASGTHVFPVDENTRVTPVP